MKAKSFKIDLGEIIRETGRKSAKYPMRQTATKPKSKKITTQTTVKIDPVAKTEPNKEFTKTFTVKKNKINLSEKENGINELKKNLTQLKMENDNLQSKQKSKEEKEKEIEPQSRNTVLPERNRNRNCNYNQNDTSNSNNSEVNKTSLSSYYDMKYVTNIGKPSAIRKEDIFHSKLQYSDLWELINISKKRRLIQLAEEMARTPEKKRDKSQNVLSYSQTTQNESVRKKKPFRIPKSDSDNKIYHHTFSKMLYKSIDKKLQKKENISPIAQEIINNKNKMIFSILGDELSEKILNN